MHIMLVLNDAILMTGICIIYLSLFDLYVQFRAHPYIINYSFFTVM